MIPFHPSKQDDQPGATLRDAMAMAALTGFCVINTDDGAPAKWDWRVIARTCYVAADAMLLARGDKHVEVAP